MCWKIEKKAKDTTDAKEEGATDATTAEDTTTEATSTEGATDAPAESTSKRRRTTAQAE